jgi:redox-sensitive bicupin YhaK (pirin superfamily)
MLIYHPKSKHSINELNKGEIIEKKIVSISNERNEIKPYSNIFYCSFIKSKNESDLSEHQHKGFEILTFILCGDIEYYDNHFNRWKKLVAGDVQMIFSGNGISHSERYNTGTEIIQIWFDPDLSKALNKEPFYKDFSSDKFPINIERGKSIVTYIGENSPLEITSEGIEIKEYSFSAKEYILNIGKKKMISAFLIEGEVYIEDKKIYKEDFFIIKNQEEVQIKCSIDSRILVIESPVKCSYKTYAEMNNIQNKFN